MANTYYGTLYTYSGETSSPDWLQGVTIAEAKRQAETHADQPRCWSYNGIWGMVLFPEPSAKRQRIYQYSRARRSGTFYQCDMTYFYECVRYLEKQAGYYACGSGNSPDSLSGYTKCSVCEVVIRVGELCGSCAEGNDPFFTSKYSDGARGAGAA